jgi:3'-5' exoribonuclease
MARAKPTLVPLHELTPDQYADCFAQLVEKKHGTTREGKPFYTCRFSDAQRIVTSMVWADSPLFVACESEWQEGQFFKVRGTYGQHERFGPQLELEQVRPARDADKEDGFDPAKLVEHSRLDPEAMFAELKQLVTEHVADEPLRRLVLTLLDAQAEPLKRLPATHGKFYPFAGGLLEHTLSVTRTCLWLVERYAAHYTDLSPPLNKGLVVAAAALHDLGRVREFGGDALGRQQTIEGRMIGHLMLGRDLVRDAARDIPDLEPELVQMLEHIVVAHLALPEWGSPRLPLVPECLIVHHADDLDAKLEMYARCLSRDRAPGPFTDRDPVLNRQLYKGRHV